jgi:malate dehydrogenase (oxaloacetate-decarboxylating)(NADP+)
VVGKRAETVKLACSGAGAAALACLDLLVSLGLRRENIWVADSHGVIYAGRTTYMDEHKLRFAQPTSARTLGEIVAGADIFLGLSAGGVLAPEMVQGMAERPLILALANPIPEILPEVAKAVRPDAIVATGRSDYPNQVNNVLCFPFIFRGALDVGATTINDPMKLAVVQAIADLAMAEPSDLVATAYGAENLTFGPEYLIPKPFDPRLIVRIAPAVARAAMDSGVATHPILDFDAYHQQLTQLVYASGMVMKPIFAAAKQRPQRIVFAEGEDERILQAVQVVVDEGIARPILIGRPPVIERQIERYGLRIRPGQEFELVNPQSDPRYHDYWESYHRLTERKGVTPEYAQIETRRRHTLIGGMLVRKGEADGMICGTFGTYDLHLHYVDQVIGKRPGVKSYAAMTGLLLSERLVFVVDTHVNLDPTAEQLAEITLMAAAEVRRFGISPRVALLSHSNFGSSDSPSAVKMRQALALIQAADPKLEVDGEMHGDCALDVEVRRVIMPRSTLKGEANLLVMPSIEAANIAYNLLKVASGGGVAIGPILLGAARPVHILTPSATVRRIVNMAALTVVNADAKTGTGDSIQPLRG